MKIFLLNGPPGCGKDTAAEMLVEEHGGQLCKFAAPLKAAATAICFRGYRPAFDEFDLDQVKKVEPREEFFGVSCRQFQIDVSEKFMKPTYGVDVFGKILRDRIKAYLDIDYPGPFFVSDSGFAPEAEVLIRAFGPSAVTLIRVYRPGHDYAGDSRGYVRLDHMGINSFDLHNDADLETFKARLLEISNNVLGVNT